MSCILSKGIKLDCTSNTGGIQSVWLAPVSAIYDVIVDEVNGTPQSADGTVISVNGPVNGYANIAVTIPGSTFNYLEFAGNVTSIYTIGTSVQFTADLVGGGQGGFSGPITASTYSPISGNTIVNISSLTSFQMIPSVNYSTFVTGGNVTFMKFEGIRNGVSFEQPSTISLENGTTFYTHTLSMTIPKQELSKRNKIHQLGAGNGKFLAVILDFNGNYWLSGVKNDGSMNEALQLVTSNAMTGKAKSDLNGYEISMTAELNTLAFKIDPTKVNLIDGTETW